jgi:ribosomal protein S1
VVCEDQRVTARVLSIDSRARRLGLSLRVNS